MENVWATRENRLWPSISVTVLDSKGKLIMESILETKAATILEFLAGLRGTLSVTSKKEPGRHGCTMCSSRTSTR
jgi:hypothetical protein